MCKLDKYKKRVQKYLDSLTDEEVKEMFTNAGFEVFEGSGEIILTEKCIECESVYVIEEANSNRKTTFCSKECEFSFQERMKRPLEFL